MNEAGLSTTIEEGSNVQFELFQSYQDEWVSYMKEGHGTFFTLLDIERKLSGL